MALEIRADVTAVCVNTNEYVMLCNNEHGIQRQGQHFDKNT